MAIWEVGEVRSSWGGSQRWSEVEKRLHWDGFLEEARASFLPRLSFSLSNHSGGISGSGDIVLAVFFGTVCLCKFLSAFRDGICDFGRPPCFSRVVDATERNGRSGSIIEEFGKGVGGFRKRKCCKVRGRRAVGINISKVIVPASFIVVK